MSLFSYLKPQCALRWPWALLVPTPSRRAFSRCLMLQYSHGGPKPRKRRASPPKVSQKGEEHQHALQAFRYAIRGDDADAVLENYQTFVERRLLGPGDTLELVWAFQRFLKRRSGASRLQPKTMRPHVRKLAALYRSGELLPHINAGTRLLALFRDVKDFEQGLEMWSWLEDRGAPYTDVATYGAAIELLTAAGQDASVSEETFGKALDSQSQVFYRYQMSPNAVLSDPDRPMTTFGTSIGLLVAIATARFQHGNWRDAYLAIDTALRLHPLQIKPHMFHLIVENRPIEEVLKAFNLWCLSGNRVNGFDIVKIFHQLRDSASLDMKAQYDRLYHVHRATMAQVSILECAVRTGQPILPELLRMLLKNAMLCVPREHALLSNNDQQQFRQLLDLLSSLVESMSRKLDIQLDALEAETFMTAVRVENMHLARDVFDRIKQSLVREPKTLRLVLTATVRSKNADLLMHVFKGLTEDGSTFSKGDILQSLVGYVSSANEIPLLTPLIEQEAANVHLDTINPLVAKIDNLSSRLQVNQTPQQKSRGAREVPNHSATALRRQESRLLELIERLQRMNGLIESPDHGQVQEGLVSWPTLSPSLCDFPNDWHRRLYDDMHIAPLLRNNEPSLSSSESNTNDAIRPKAGLQVAATGTISSTGLSIGEVRFQSFKAMNNILVLAAAHERMASHPPSSGSSASSSVCAAVSPTETLEKLSTSGQDLFPGTEEEWRARVLFLRDAQVFQPVKTV